MFPVQIKESQDSLFCQKSVWVKLSGFIIVKLSIIDVPQVASTIATL